MKAITLTPVLIRAAAQDAAAAHARKHGRSVWNQDDANVAADTFARLVRQCYGEPSDTHQAHAFIRFQEAEAAERRGRFASSTS